MNHFRQLNSSPARARRLPVTFAALALLFSIATPAVALEPLKSYAVLSLKDGRTLSSVEVVNYTATDVLIRHLGGATSIGTDLLPDQVLKDLHLKAPTASLPLITDPALLALADKVAVVDGASSRGFKSVDFSSVSSAPLESNVSPEQLQAAASARPDPAAPVAPAGEGNIVHFFTPSTGAPGTPPGAAARSQWTTLPGRIAVTSPSGSWQFLRDVEVRAYPAALLTRYLVRARTNSSETAQQLRTQAAQLAEAGRRDECEAVLARAAQAEASYLDLMPLAPYRVTSDEQGYFSFRHDLHEIRIVATARLKTAQGELIYTWAGLAPGEQALLTEANATSVRAADAPPARYAAR
jgi:hypothetical protein